MKKGNQGLILYKFACFPGFLLSRVILQGWLSQCLQRGFEGLQLFTPLGVTLAVVLQNG